MWGHLKNFNRGAHVIFWGLKFNQLLFWGLLKTGAILEGLKNKHYFFELTRNLHYFGFLKKQTTELIPRNRFHWIFI